MHLIQGTPNLYLQQPGILQAAGERIGRFGTTVHIITGYKSWAAVESVMTQSLQQHGIEYVISRYNHQCSYAEIERLSARVDSSCQLIVGAGGGKLLDTAKAVAANKQIDFVSIPTLASTCSPVTPLSVIYSDEGEYQRSEVWTRNSVLTLVDTDVIAKSPLQYLLSGIGDTLAKWYEGRISAQGREDFPTQAALNSAILCRDTILTHAKDALVDVQAGSTSPHFESIVHTIFLGAGMVGGLGGDSCRAAAAHAFHNGITLIPNTKKSAHGEKVAYGILVQLALEERQRELEELMEFYQEIGLPTAIKDIGMDLSVESEELVMQALQKATEVPAMRVMPFPVTAGLLREAIEVVESSPSI